MSDEKRIVLWGERGLVASLFIDLHNSLSLKAWQQLLSFCKFVDPHWAGQEVASVNVIVEPDFSNGGFGHPDAIAKVTFASGESIVLIWEAKRTPYSTCCLPPASRGGAGYNSALNGQLELNHCLALALSEYREGVDSLTEPAWVLHSPYAVERRGRLRALKNPVVIEQIAKQYSGLPFGSYYQLIVTTDTVDPLEVEENADLWPELYHPDFPFQNCWSALRKQFGWASWQTIKGTVSRLQTDGLVTSSLFLPSFESNSRNFPRGDGLILPPEVADEVSDGDLSEPVSAASRSTFAASRKGASRGATMIFAPAINPATFLHFSWFNESSALRDYSKSPTIMPFEDRKFRTSDVRRQITKEIVIRNRRPISDTQYWHETTQNVNRSELSRGLGQD